MKNWITSKTVFGRTTTYKGGLIGIKSDSPNAIEIEAGANYNGSGREYFGGAYNWPSIKMKIGFQVGEDNKRDLFIKKLQDFIDKEL